MSGRNGQIARIYSLLDLLDGATDSYTVHDLWEKMSARGHEVAKRTIYRDLDALSQAGFPLTPEGEGENNIRWKLERKARVSQYFILTARELFALYLARGSLAPLKNTPFYGDLESIFKKLEEKLGDKHQSYLESLEQELKFEPGPQWGLGLNPDILETLRSACAETQILSCSYYSVNSKKESVRRIGPHYLYYVRGGLYLVGEDLGDHKVKVFAVPRIKTAEMLDEVYEGTIVTPEELFSGAMGVYTGTQSVEVTLEFEAEAAHFVKERRWHTSQRVTMLEGGRLRVQLEVAETPELSAWVLGFGPGVKVVSPTTLAERVSALALSTFENYKKKAG